jgi:hypothetical protein
MKEKKKQANKPLVDHIQGMVANQVYQFRAAYPYGKVLVAKSLLESLKKFFTPKEEKRKTKKGKKHTTPSKTVRHMRAARPIPVPMDVNGE